jgi:hypothetical protein
VLSTNILWCIQTSIACGSSKRGKSWKGSRCPIHADVLRWWECMSVVNGAGKTKLIAFFVLPWWGLPAQWKLILWCQVPCWYTSTQGAKLS